VTGERGHRRGGAPDDPTGGRIRRRPLPRGKRAALSEARKILRQACHILAELGDDALSAA
jgi:transposase